MYSGQSFFGHVPFLVMQIKNKNLVLTWKKTMWEKKMLVSKLKALAYEKRYATQKYTFVYKRLAISH